MNISFPTDYRSILEKIDRIDPIEYGKTRNYTDGAVTMLSPYISRGVISTKQVLTRVLEKGYQLPQIEPFVKELCWRDYFQRVAQHKNLGSDIRQPQHPVSNHGISESVLKAETGIVVVDHAINQLYTTGYMHNHCRMYVASMVCNMGRSHWKSPAQWMYYHLLDGDPASNICSWQWVAGANSAKKYYANQENINRYTHTNQTGTFLDVSYEELELMDIPAALSVVREFVPEYFLPESSVINIDPTLPTYIYNYFNLDPAWHQHEKGNRILLIEPEFFRNYPISRKCFEFMLALSENIPGTQVYVGSFDSLIGTFGLIEISFKEHPLNIGYKGTEDPRDWISEKVTGYHPSFFSYWKKVSADLA